MLRTVSSVLAAKRLGRSGVVAVGMLLISIVTPAMAAEAEPVALPVSLGSVSTADHPHCAQLAQARENGVTEKRVPAQCFATKAQAYSIATNNPAVQGLTDNQIAALVAEAVAPTGQPASGRASGSVGSGPNLLGLATKDANQQGDALYIYGGTCTASVSYVISNLGAWNDKISSAAAFSNGGCGWWKLYQNAPPPNAAWLDCGYHLQNGTHCYGDMYNLGFNDQASSMIFSKNG